jgi:hypothetical protein
VESETNSVEQKKSKKSKIIGLVVAILVVIIGGLYGVHYYQQVQEKKAEEKHAKQLKAYQEDLNSFLDSAYEAGVTAEDVVSTFSDVWHSAIFDDFVTVNGQKYTDFNEVLQAQYDLYLTDGTFDKLDSAFEESNTIIKNLKNTPKEYEMEYEAALDVFDSLNDFVSLAKNPKGSLTTFNQESSEKDNAMASDIQKLDNMLN